VRSRVRGQRQPEVRGLTRLRAHDVSTDAPVGLGDGSVNVSKAANNMYLFRARLACSQRHFPMGVPVAGARGVAGRAHACLPPVRSTIQYDTPPCWGSYGKETSCPSRSLWDYLARNQVHVDYCNSAQCHEKGLTEQPVGRFPLNYLVPEVLPLGELNPSSTVTATETGVLVKSS
jgi:hypothetical protein